MPAGRPDEAIDGAPQERWDVVVIGAGVAGLVAARDLAAAGRRTLVVDARDAPGGAVRGHEVAGLRLDAGAESFATRGRVVADYLTELGLAERICTPSGLGSWVHLPSGDGPLPRTGLLGIPSTPWSADVRRTIGLLGAARASLDLALPRRVGADASTLGALVRARMGTRVLDRLVRPIVGGVHAAEPGDLAVGAVAPTLPGALAGSRGSLARAVRTLRASAPAGSAVGGISGGMNVLVNALAEAVQTAGGEVRVRTAVSAARTDDDGWTLTTSEGTLRTHAVLLAAPAPDLLPALLPSLAPASQPDPGAEVTLVTLVVDAPALDRAPRGTGVLVAREATDVQAKALTHATAKWPWLAARTPPGRHVVRLSYGRADGVRTAGDDATLPAPGAGVDPLATALTDASVLLGTPLTRDQLVDHAVVRWTQALPRPSAAHRAFVASVRAAVEAGAADADAGVPMTGRPHVAVAGAWVAGNGLASVIPDARAAARSLLG